MADDSEPLPAEKLQNPPKGKGALGNQHKGKMHYSGNDRIDLVKVVQQMLIELGDDIGDTGPEKDGVDGDFGDKTEKAVKDFQKSHSDFEGNDLKVDGLVGPKTSDALNREMVGHFFDRYLTPLELTEETLIVTSTSDGMKEPLSVEVEEAKDVKLFMVDLTEFKVTLFDFEGEQFQSGVDAKFQILDNDGNVIAEGTAKTGEDISVFAHKTPKTAVLNVDDVFYEFPLSSG